MHVRLLDVVLRQRRMHRQRVGETLAQQLAGYLTRQLMTLLGRKLAGESDLQLRIGTTVLPLKDVRG